MKKIICSVIFTFFSIFMFADVEIGGINYSLDTQNRRATVVSKKPLYSGDIVIPESFEYDNVRYRVAKIGVGAFRDCEQLTSIQAKSIDTICNVAFVGCTALKSVDFDNNRVSYIGSYAFQYCESLTSFVLPWSMEEISAGILFGCAALKKVTVSSHGVNFVKIGSYAFGFCRNLEEIDLETGYSRIKDIEGAAFSHCSSLTSFQMPYYIDTISPMVFDSCVSLSSINLSSIQYIGESAFQNCLGLTELKLSSALFELGDLAFAGCKNIASISCAATTPPTCGWEVFDGVSVSTITPEVPIASVNSYRVANTWKDFNWGDSPIIDDSFTTFNVTVPEGTDACYLVGDMNNWNIEDPIAMTKIDDTHYTYIAESDLTGNMYKYAHGADWKYIEKDAQSGEISNRVVNAVEMNDVVAMWADEPSGLDDINATINVNKFMHNGQLYILRDGNLYNATGARVK